jgi:hypothetical protein
LPGQPLGDQRAGNAGADDQRVAFRAFAQFGTGRMPGCRIPGGAAAAQIGLFGIV